MDSGHPQFWKRGCALGDIQLMNVKYTNLKSKRSYKNESFFTLLFFECFPLYFTAFQLTIRRCICANLITIYDALSDLSFFCFK